MLLCTALSQWTLHVTSVGRNYTPGCSSNWLKIAVVCDEIVIDRGGDQWNLECVNKPVVSGLMMRGVYMVFNKYQRSSTYASVNSYASWWSQRKPLYRPPEGLWIPAFVSVKGVRLHAGNTIQPYICKSNYQRRDIAEESQERLTCSLRRFRWTQVPECGLDQLEE